MNQFQKTIIEPILNDLQPKKMLEIGVLEGHHTHALLTWCRSSNCGLTSVDPTPWAGKIPEACKPGAEGYQYKRGHESEKDVLIPHCIEKIFEEGLQTHWTCIKSLSLPFLAGCQESFDVVFVDGDHNYYTVLHELTYLAALITPQGRIFIHDVTNPSCAYQDYYYDFTLIPEAFRGKDKQGIVTAIDDFLKQFPDFTYQVLTEADNGLGVIQYR